MADVTVYISDALGSDAATTSGTSPSDPFKTLLAALLRHGDSAKYLVAKPPGDDSSSDPQWEPPAKSGMKKAKSLAAAEKKKAEKAKELVIRLEKEEAERQKVLEDSKKIIVEEDKSLPEPTTIKLWQKGPELLGKRVKVTGRAHRARKQKDLLFVTLRDGHGYLQCILSGNLSKCYDALTLTLESSLMLLGTLQEVPAGAHAPDNRELQVDYFNVVGMAVGGADAINTRIQKDTEHSILLDLRHLTLRGEHASGVILVRDAVEYAFHQVYRELHMRKVSPPALVQTQCEGGATLFAFDYYKEEAYLTQSSQLYLETVLPALGDCWCIEKSFRAEKSLTRRHLSEYAHIEAELDFITFDDLLNHLEMVICRVLELALSSPEIDAIVKKLNPEFKMPRRPFRRMRYAEAIEWLNEHDIVDEDGKKHEFGDDIAEAAERKMTDTINEPILLTHFPVEIKAFYMQKDKDDPRVTESVDVLMPNVGEIVGGSMRMWDYGELMEAYKRVGIEPEPYYWYTDQRRYGTSPHGGYGMGMERLLAWLCNQHTVRDACLYPRFMGRCKP